MYRVDKEDLRKIIMELSVLRCRIQEHHDKAKQESERLDEAGDWNRMDKVDNIAWLCEDADESIFAAIECLKEIK